MSEGVCLQIEYTGAQVSCLLIGDATAKTLTSKIGAAGAEAVDAAFGIAGVLDLTLATVDTLLELKAVIDAYADYTAAVLYGDDLATENILDQTVQAKGTPGYVLFVQTSVLSATALTTWARAKLLLYQIHDSDQTTVEYLINAASETAESYARRPIKARALTSDLDGSGREKLIVPVYPVNSVTSLYQDATRAFAVATLLAEGTDFLVYGDEGFLVYLNGVWTEGRKTIRLTWNGGLATVDERLQDAVLEVVSWNIKRFRGSGIGVRSISAPDGLNTALELEIPLSARRVFESYRDGR